MKSYTQEEFDKFLVIEGIKQCPTGNYTAIKYFTEKCSFSEECSFSEGSIFVERCKFAGWCKFAEWCSFGKWCHFSAGCTFAEGCNFGGCIFTGTCSFAEHCRFYNSCLISGHEMLDSFVRSLSGVGTCRRTLYVWNTKDGWFCQAGCRFDKEETFLFEVRRRYGNDSHYERAVKFLKEI